MSVSRAERDSLLAMLQGTRDPRVHDRVWDYLEGRISRPRLFRDRDVAPVLAAAYRERIALARERGFDPEEVRRLVERRQQDGTD